MMVVLIDESTGDVEWTGPLAELCAANDFDDVEVERVEHELHHHGAAAFGGGAMPRVRIEVLKWDCHRTAAPEQDT